MKAKLIIAVLAVLTLYCCLPGCTQSKINKESILIYENATLDQFFGDPACLDTTKISILAPKSSSWETFFEVPPEKIEEGLEILTTAKRGFMPAWLYRLVIETHDPDIEEDKKYIFNFGWNRTSAYTDHAESEDFRKFLRECGLPEPQ